MCVVSEVAHPGNVQASRLTSDGDMFFHLQNWKFKEHVVGPKNRIIRRTEFCATTMLQVKYPFGIPAPASYWDLGDMNGGLYMWEN